MWPFTFHADSVPLTDKQLLELEIHHWKYSPERLMQLDGERYYRGDHDILKHKRTAIGEGGKVQEITNLPNNRIVNNQFAKIVDQKANYLLSKVITFESDNETYNDELRKIFNERLQNKFKNGGVDALCGGLFWLYVYYNEKGELAFQRFKPYEILPFWKDAEHTDLDFAIRLYEVEGYEGTQPKIFEKVEIFRKDGIEYYDWINNELVPDIDRSHSYYAYVGEQGFNWDNRVPLIAFKYNEREIPLLKKVKGLQDALNLMYSELLNNMQEDKGSTILVIENYDGQDLGEFRRNLATYRAVKVRSGEGARGDVRSLQVEVNADNYELVLQALKKAIVENAMGYDFKDDRMGQNSNMLNIKSIFSDIDLDADNMENEFRVALYQLLFFVNSYLQTTGKGDFSKEHVNILFNRDTVINETEVINSLVSLGVRVPNELLLAQVPFINDVDKALKILKEEEREMDVYNNTFGGVNGSTGTARTTGNTANR